MAEERLPPQLMALSAAGGGFVGAFVAVIIIWIFAGPLCCDHGKDQRATSEPAATLSAAPVARPEPA